MTWEIAAATLSPHDVDPQGGFGALETPRGNLPLVALDVQAKICELNVECCVRQAFRNTLDEMLEATYIFPLPDRAAVTNFTLRVADRVIVAELQERGQARETYDKAIQQGHRAAIAEEERSGVFTIRVGNLPPHEVAHVELTLVGPLPVADGEATFRFPLVVAPRYTSGLPLDGPSVGLGTTPDTDVVPDASRVTPPVLLPGFPNPVQLSLSVELDPTNALAKQPHWHTFLRSSLHSMVVQDSGKCVVRLQPGERLNRDFILRFPVLEKSLGSTLRASRADKQPGFFALTLLPPAQIATPPQPRDVVFLLDRSGSMSGWKIVAARRALGRMIDTLLDHDRFTVIAFDSSMEQPHAMKAGLASATNRQRWQTLEWLGGVDARGGTELEAAISLGLKSFPSEAGRQRLLVVVTDGQVSGEDAILKRIGKIGGERPRIFAIGIDRSVNAGFLQRLADIGQGQCELVESETRLDDAMNRIHRLLGQPVLTDVQLLPVESDWQPDTLMPSHVPDLFADRPVTVYGRHLSSHGQLRFRIVGKNAHGERCEQEVVSQPGEDSMLRSLWGRAAVRHWEDVYASGGANVKIQQRIIACSLECQVLSRFTAYVAVDRAEVVNPQGKLTQVVQPVETPSAWAMPAPGLAARSKLRKQSKSVFSFGFFGASASSPPVDSSDAAYGSPPPPAESESVDSMLCEFTDTAIHFTGDDEDVDSFPPIDVDALTTAKLLEYLIEVAERLHAVEILITPHDDRLEIHYRIEDRLVAQDTPPLRLLHSLVFRIRVLASLLRLPRDVVQNGTFVVTIRGRDYHCSVCITPTLPGEAIVLTLNEVVPAGTAPQRKTFWK